ncbi:MAG: hypothetical protein U9M90_03360 [Patescibacteria group bacterium]|nr:hypothetical protein [Patescibacteria group bacterium]
MDMDAKTARRITEENKKRMRKKWEEEERQRKKEVIDRFNIANFLEEIFKEIEVSSKEGDNSVSYDLCRFEGSWHKDRLEEQRIIGEHLVGLLRHKGFKAECNKETFTSGGEYFGIDTLIIYIAIAW